MHFRGGHGLSAVNYYITVWSCSITQVSWLPLVFNQLPPPTHTPPPAPPPFTRRYMLSQWSAAYGRKSASEAVQEWRRRRYSSCKHAMWSTISSAVRNLMIKIDRMLCAFQPAQPRKHSSIDGEGWGGGGRERGIFLWEGTSAPISLYLHHSNFFFTFMPQALRLVLRSEMLQDNADVHFPTRTKKKKKHLVLMFSTSHEFPQWMFQGKALSCPPLFFPYYLFSKSWL